MKIERILNRAAAVALSPTFEIPKDGKFHLARTGEFPGEVETEDGQKFTVIQVIDDQAISAMANRFAADKAQGAHDLLVDADHLSADPKNDTVARGWITNVSARGGDLYGDIRLSAQGQSDIKGGLYRYVSSVWNVAPIGQQSFTPGCRVRPFQLTEAGLTNRPQIQGLGAISNRATLGRNSETEVARCVKRSADRARAIHNRAKQLLPAANGSFARAWNMAKDEFPEMPITAAVANRTIDPEAADKAKLLDDEEARWKASQPTDKDCGRVPMTSSQASLRKVFLAAVQKYVDQGMPFRAAWAEAKEKNPSAYFHFAGEA